MWKGSMWISDVDQFFLPSSQRSFLDLQFLALLCCASNKAWLGSVCAQFARKAESESGEIGESEQRKVELGESKLKVNQASAGSNRNSPVMQIGFFSSRTRREKRREEKLLRQFSSLQNSSWLVSTRMGCVVEVDVDVDVVWTDLLSLAISACCFHRPLALNCYEPNNNTGDTRLSSPSSFLFLFAHLSWKMFSKWPPS